MSTADVSNVYGSALEALWPLLLLMVAAGIIGRILIPRYENFLARRALEKRKLRGAQWVLDQDFLQWLRGMDPTEFERYISDIFSKLGYSAEVSGGANDGGIDVVFSKDGVRYYVQCKKYRGAMISVGEIREFYGALAHYRTNGKGYFITTTKFSLEAERFAADKPIELIDGFRLIDYIRLADEVKQSIKGF